MVFQPGPVAPSGNAEAFGRLPYNWAAVYFVATNAEVRAAVSLGEPRRLLDMLKKTEDARMANMAMATSRSHHSPCAMRRMRLQNRLGLD